MLNLDQRSSIRRQANRVRLVKVAFAIMMVVGLLHAPDLMAQEPATALEFLDVELWPDFDQPSLLVLLSGSLPEDAPLPATITVPIPEEATINAVARVDSLGNLLNMEEYDSVPGELTLNVTEPGFRIEYYVPYERDGDLRKLDFQWLAGLDVNQLITTLQQPSSATDVNLSPEAVRSLNGQYDLLYHEIKGQVVPAGVPYSFEASYRMVRPELSAEVLALEQPPVPSPIITQQGQAGSSDSDINWLIVLAATVAVLAFGAVGYLIYSGRKRSQRVIKPRPAARSRRRQSRPVGGKSASDSRKSNFCHECGQPLEPADKFCRNCGTPLKTAGG